MLEKKNTKQRRDQTNNTQAKPALNREYFKNIEMWRATLEKIGVIGQKIVRQFDRKKNLYNVTKTLANEKVLIVWNQSKIK